MYGMAKAKELIIVESPAKAKTIENYLGGNYKVMSSYGHIRDLPKKGLSINIEADFEPTYQISPEKQKTVTELKKAADTAAKIWLASDEDREGEAIAWHLCKALGIDDKTAKRLVFHEITRPAIEAALQKPRPIDQKLVDAQQARRVLDRLVGYELSPVLWKKIRPGLSAGRVQSVAVRLIVERENEIRNFEPVAAYRVTGSLQTKAGEPVPVEASERLSNIDKAREYLKALSDSNLIIKNIDETPGTRSPSPPLTTSTLQQEASRRLGYAVRYTMRLAQSLYEAGKITYMRTDSVNLAEQAIEQARAVITDKFGEEYSKPTRYQTKTKGAQEAHEAIRPTDFRLERAGDDSAEEKLYDLIRRRALASQMAPAQVKKTTVAIEPSKADIPLLAKGEVLVFPGFMRLLGAKDDVILPKLAVGEQLQLANMLARETFSKPPARYTESSLVRKLEELGIGRPSTYAPTISTIQDRGYVEKGASEGEERPITTLELVEKGRIEERSESERYGSDSGKLIPTPTAEQVTEFLVKYFPDIVDYSFTADVENGLDEVAEGKERWQKLIREFYDSFHKAVKGAEEIKRSEAAQARLIGTDPKNNLPIYVRYGRYGPIVQRGEGGDDDEKPDFAPLPEGERIETIDLQSALKALELPRTLGKTDDGEVVSANIGRFGPYLKVGQINVSVRGEDPYRISLGRAKELIAEHARKEAAKYIQRFEKEKIDIINGRYGPYITDGKKNAKIPKDVAPEKIDLDTAVGLLAAAPERKRRFARRSKK